MRRGLLLVLVSFSLGLSMNEMSAHAGGKGKSEPNYLIVMPPAGGKEVKLVDYRFTLGTRLLSLNGDGKSKGQEYLEFREEKSTTYKNGIYTLIPLTSVKKLAYDAEKKSVTVVALKDNGEEATLLGATKFVGSNKLTIEAEAVLEGLGNATVKFNGGVDKGGLKSITFPTPKAPEKLNGSAATVIADDKEKTKHMAFDVQPLYLVDGRYRVVPYLMFKKTVKVEMNKLAGFRFIPSDDKKKVSTDYEVTLKDGAKHTLSILTTVEADKKKMTLVGLIGRVEVGYKLFSTDAILEYRADAEKDTK